MHRGLGGLERRLSTGAEPPLRGLRSEGLTSVRFPVRPFERDPDAATSVGEVFVMDGVEAESASRVVRVGQEVLLEEKGGFSIMWPTISTRQAYSSVPSQKFGANRGSPGT